MKLLSISNALTYMIILYNDVEERGSPRSIQPCKHMIRPTHSSNFNRITTLPARHDILEKGKLI